MISRGTPTCNRLLSGAVLALVLGLSFGASPAARAQGSPQDPQQAPGQAQGVTLGAASSQGAASGAPTATPKEATAKQGADEGKEREPAWKMAWRKQWQEEQTRKAKTAKKQDDAPHTAATAPPASPASTGTASPPTAQRQASPVAGATATPSAPAAPSSAAPPANSVLSETKPDGPGANETAAQTADKTQDSPLTTTRDAWKMLLYLVPTLLLIVGILAGLRRFQERNGRLPGPLQAAARRQTGRTVAAGGGWIGALVSGLQQNRARQRGGSSIRLVESVPMGGSYLHLVEVRGRLLLLGASGNGLALLTEFTDPNALETDEFRALLHAAAADLETLDADTTELPPSALVGSMEEGLRDTNDTLARRARRLRTVQEAEDAFVERTIQERRR